MKDVKDITALVVDHGLFLPLAQKLGEIYKRVLYHTPWEQGFPTVNQCVIGDGFERIERCDDLWAVKDEVDVFIFPDILHSGLQLELVKQGKAVWGSRRGDEMEWNRELFHRTLAEVGLEVPKFEVVVGISRLRDHLKDETDKVIKISRFRGSIETCKWRSYALDENMLDAWAVQFGMVKELVRFLVFDKIDTNIEIGADTFNIRGQFPKRMIQGYECKDEGFLSAITDRDAMPDQIKEVLEAFAPVLARYDYANNFSMELRVTDEKSYFIDPCCRFPMPPTSSTMETWTNWPEIIWAGAHGELVEPETDIQFAAECAVTLCGDKKEWRATEVPKELQRWLKFNNCCQVDERICFPPLEFSEDKVGWLVATAQTLPELIKTLMARVELLPPGLHAKSHTLVELLEEIHEAEDLGLEFTEQRVPEPAAVVETGAA